MSEYESFAEVMGFYRKGYPHKLFPDQNMVFDRLQAAHEREVTDAYTRGAATTILHYEQRGDQSQDSVLLRPQNETGDEYNFSGVESDMDASDAEARPEKTSGGESDHVTSGTRSVTAELRNGGIYRFPSDTKVFQCSELAEIADRIDRAVAFKDGVLDAAIAECKELRGYADWLRDAHRDKVLESAALTAERDSLKQAAERDADVMESLNLSLEDVTAERDELQKRLDESEHDQSMYADRIRKLERERDELQSTVDAMRDTDAYKMGYDEGFASADDWLAQHEDAMCEHGWVKLPVDADGIRWDGTETECVTPDGERVRCDGLTYDGEAWRIWVPSENIEFYAHRCRHVKSEPDTADRIVRELTLGSITETEAIERIGALHG